MDDTRADTSARTSGTEYVRQASTVFLDVCDDGIILGDRIYRAEAGGRRDARMGPESCSRMRPKARGYRAEECLEAVLWQGVPISWSVPHHPKPFPAVLRTC